VISHGAWERLRSVFDKEEKTMCNNECKICERAIFSTGVSIVDGTLVIDIPTGYYGNNCNYCLFVIQAIPDAATINMPVAISIGGDTTTLYPLVRCDCVQATACAIRTRRRYCVKVSTNNTSAVFKVLKGLSCAPNNVLAAIPVPAATPGA
jgi:hypothetical protein